MPVCEKRLRKWGGGGVPYSMPVCEEILRKGGWGGGGGLPYSVMPMCGKTY